jgi:Glu-tRNA(Gln) amidotransferase subunit E-like FAD-binding protein
MAKKQSNQFYNTCKNPEASVMEAMEKMNISSMSEEELNNIVQRTVPQFENLIMEGIGSMGTVMGRL